MIDPHNFINSENVHSIICDKMGLIDSFFFPEPYAAWIDENSRVFGGKCSICYLNLLIYISRKKTMPQEPNSKILLIDMVLDRKMYFITCHSGLSVLTHEFQINISFVEVNKRNRMQTHDGLVIKIGMGCETPCHAVTFICFCSVSFAQAYLISVFSSWKHFEYYENAVQMVLFNQSLRIIVFLP